MNGNINSIKVMVVDDSAVIRGLLTKMLSAESGIEVVETANNGLRALNRLAQLELDVIVLDIEMPVMDGLTALPKLLALKPDVQIVVASTLTRKNAEISLRCLQAGAADYIAKPGKGQGLISAEDFKRDLVGKVKALGSAARNVTATSSQARAPSFPEGPGVWRKPALEKKSPLGRKVNPGPARNKTITIRPMPPMHPGAIAIGSSTGGPKALHSLFESLRGLSISQPIFITQHMPPTFTTLLAQHLERSSGRPCREGCDGLKPVGGEVIVAPGDYHMTVEGTAASPVIKLNQSPPKNFCRPSVDPMLNSLVRLYNGKVLFVMLTGMGADGLNATRNLIDCGGLAVAQDEETSVVWGMPGAVATAGLCSAVLPLS
ncbi:MAG: chemotaxis response regulator protein-glutamate methylesterase, partial [Kiloniellales bacterium]|nr:chemotaxis response regulator protein-glutamate methylesterase [Kiloniellales bacterium]